RLIWAIPVHVHNRNNRGIFFPCWVDSHHHRRLMPRSDDLHALVAKLLKLVRGHEHTLFKQPLKLVAQLELVRVLADAEHFPSNELLVVVAGLPSRPIVSLDVVLAGTSLQLLALVRLDLVIEDTFLVGRGACTDLGRVRRRTHRGDALVDHTLIRALSLI